MGKCLHTLKTSTEAKIIKFSSEKGINKSEFVELAVDTYEEDLENKLLTLKSDKELLLAKLSLIDEKVSDLERLKGKEKALVDSLGEQKKEFMKNISRKMKEGEVVEAVEIAKRVGRLLRCSYLELLPSK